MTEKVVNSNNPNGEEEICGNCYFGYKEPDGTGTCTYTTGPENPGQVDLSKGPAYNYRRSTLPGDANVWGMIYESKGRTCFKDKKTWEPHHYPQNPE